MNKNDNKKPKVTIQDPIEELIKRYDKLLYFVIGILLVGFVILLITVLDIATDSFRFSSASYENFSRDTKIYNQLLETNKELLEIVKQSQDQIINNLQEKK